MDKYDRAVERLLACNGEFQSEAIRAWCNNNTHPSGCLFQFAGTTDGHNTGCLTMIRCHVVFVAETEELTMAIRADKRIPKRKQSITRESLPVFAEWQRRLDRELPSRQPQTEWAAK